MGFINQLITGGPHIVGQPTYKGDLPGLLTTYDLWDDSWDDPRSSEMWINLL